MTLVEETPEGRLYDQMRKRCPTCGLSPSIWMRGPSGGASVNKFCGRCGAGYNVTDIIGIAEKIHNSPRYILPQFKNWQPKHLLYRFVFGDTDQRPNVAWWMIWILMSVVVAYAIASCVAEIS